MPALTYPFVGLQGFLLSSMTGVLFRRPHLTREASSLRIGFLGIRDIEGMGEFLSVFSTLFGVFFVRRMSSMNSCTHRCASSRGQPSLEEQHSLRKRGYARVRRRNV